MSTFVLHIEDLDESGKDWNFAIGTDWLSHALRDSELKPGARDGKLEVHAQRSGEDVLVRGRVAAELLASCARCLDDVSLGVDLALTALYSPEHRRAHSTQEVEVQPGEVNQDYFGGNEIVLDSIVREQLLLENPMKPLCSEDCEGIAVPKHIRPPDEVFGDSVPDARFAPLLKLKEKLIKKEE